MCRKASYNTFSIFLRPSVFGSFALCSIRGSRFGASMLMTASEGYFEWSSAKKDLIVRLLRNRIWYMASL